MVKQILFSGKTLQEHYEALKEKEYFFEFLTAAFVFLMLSYFNSEPAMSIGVHKILLLGITICIIFIIKVLELSKPGLVIFEHVADEVLFLVWGIFSVFYNYSAISAPFFLSLGVLLYFVFDHGFTGVRLFYVILIFGIWIGAVLYNVTGDLNFFIDFSQFDGAYLRIAEAFTDWWDYLLNPSQFNATEISSLPIV